MQKKALLSWARANIEPITDLYGGQSYRVSARLKDGLVLPCVQICPTQPLLELALRRFDETRPRLLQRRHVEYRTVVKSFVCAGSRIAEHEIEDVWESDYAIPSPRLKEIHGETSMSWTAFAAIMDDGLEFSFGTTWSMEFFNMPDGYSGKRIVNIISHKNQVQPVYREKPFFRCYMDYDQ